MPWNSTRPQWRDTLRSLAFPRINKFKPDIIFISAGFDGHEKDSISYGFSKFIEFDYSWITGELQKLANKHCEGRIISVLEGGYNVKGSILSPLAQSVNFHVSELRSRSKEQYIEPTATELEKLAEKDRELEEKRQKANQDSEKENMQSSKRTRRAAAPQNYEQIQLGSESEEILEYSEDSNSDMVFYRILKHKKENENDNENSKSKSNKNQDQDQNSEIIEIQEEECPKMETEQPESKNEKVSIEQPKP